MTQQASAVYGRLYQGTAKQQPEKDGVIGEVRHLADKVMHHRNGREGRAGKNPPQDGFDDPRSVRSRESRGRKRNNTAIHRIAGVQSLSDDRGTVAPFTFSTPSGASGERSACSI
jgi:hypothetical protein